MNNGASGAASGGCPFSRGAGSAVMPRLKSETQGLHDAAEHHPFQRTLFKGRLPIEGYVAWLGQMDLVHRGLESSLRRAAAKVPAIAAVVTEEQYQTPYLAEDLTYFGLEPGAAAAEPSVREMEVEFARCEAERPLALLGHHYVLEGSNNGGRFIAMSLRKAYGLKPGSGDRYLDPYADRQPELWGAFKAAMGAQAFTTADEDVLVRAAESMFDGVRRLSDDLWAKFGTDAASGGALANGGADIVTKVGPAGVGGTGVRTSDR